MATQLQRAYGLTSGKEAIPALEPKSTSKKEPRPEKKGDGKRGPFPNLPRRPFGVDREG